MGHPRVIWRGEVYEVDLGQPIGHEPAFRRPAVVVSVDILNNSPWQLTIVERNDCRRSEEPCV